MDNNATFLRQLDIYNPDIFNGKIHIIGAGGVGSAVGLLLGKMGFKDIVLYDFDTVEQHNCPNQLFTLADIGKSKVEALQGHIKDFGYDNTNVEIVNDKFNADKLSDEDIVIMGVDNMSARKEIFYMLRGKVKFFIDARMGGELFTLYTIESDEDNVFYSNEDILYSSSDATQLPCTAKAILYNTFVIAGLIARQVCKKLRGADEVYREVTFDLNLLEFIKE